MKMKIPFLDNWEDYNRICNYARDYPGEFWSDAGSILKWEKNFSSPYEKNANGSYRWFVDGELNYTESILDKFIRMGKGSNRRKGDNQKQYAENWEKIFGKGKKKKEKKKDA